MLLYLLKYLLLCSVLVSFTHRSEGKEPTTIRLVSEEWIRATQSDGQGLHWDIFRYVFEPVGITVETDTMDYQDAVNHVHRGLADAWVASALHEKDFPLYPKWHYDAEIISIVFDASKHQAFKGISSLSGKKVAWITGYEYQKYVHVPMFKVEVDKRLNILKMLKSGRIDYFLDPKIDATLAKKTYFPDDDSIVIREFKTEWLYPAFANTPKGEKLRRIWDQRMPEIAASKKMRSLFKQWGFIYPLDKSPLTQ